MRVLATCLSIRRPNVSMPCKIVKALAGLITAPKSRKPSRRARNEKEATEDSSAKTMP